MDTLLTVATLSAGLRLAVPVALAALGALVGERAGVLNLGIEGTMLTGALTGYLVADGTGSPWLGLLAGALAGALAGVVLAVVMVDVRANQIVTGLAFTLLAVAGTSFVFEQSFAIGDTPPRLTTITMPALVVMTGLVFLAAWFVLDRTTAGLALTAVGETPQVADALGYRVAMTRRVALVVGNALAGLGGAVLVCGPLGIFIQNVTAGRGWVALALVVFARWRPLVALGGALLFGLCDAAQLRLQGTSTAVPYEVFLALPYLVTLLAMVVRARDSRTPASLGVPFTRGALE